MKRTMKRSFISITIILLLLTAAAAAGAQEENRGNVRVVGKVDYGNNQTAVISTTGGGNAMVQFRHFMLDLDPKENRQFVSVLKKGIQLVDVAVENNTSIQLMMGAGQVMSTNDVKVRVKFETDGTGGEESCTLPIQLSNRTDQEDLVFRKAQAQQMIEHLNTCHETASNIEKQLKLFVEAKQSEEEE